MSVKFKVGFTISGETVFALIAKMLPIEDLNVEELPPTKTTGERELAELAHSLHPRRLAHKRASPGPNLKKGINGIIMVALKDKPMRATELQPLLKAAGFSSNSVNSRLEALRNQGVLERIGDGRWKINAA